MYKYFIKFVTFSNVQPYKNCIALITNCKKNILTLNQGIQEGDNLCDM